MSGPEGRFHHDGQPAIYTSLSAEGAGLALAIYLHPDDPPREIHTLELSGGPLLDLDAPDPQALAGIDPAVASERWQERLAEGAWPRTWTLSDRLRGAGYHGVIYRSRRAPEHRHATLFGWNRPGAPVLRAAGPSRPWSPPG